MKNTAIFATGVALISIFLLSSQVGAQKEEAPPAAEQARPSVTAITEAWLASPHADKTSEAFIHWNEDGEIPGTCATCHSGTGFIDYIQGPMSTPGILDHPIGLGSVVDCQTCHNPATAALDTVPFPSGESVSNLGSSAMCSVCHQGRASTGTVETAVSGMDADTISADLGFINIHYAASAATLMGSVVHGGYEYADKVYKGQFTHVPEVNTCTSCHNPHSLEVSMETCATCHKGIEEFTDIRTSRVDFDGDGDMAEGIYHPIKTLHASLNTAIQAYASDVLDAPIVYAPNSYPYFFIDGDNDGQASAEESIYPNRYQSWTPRLLRAAYNYQFIAKDKAAYTHNPHYALQLLYDSLENLSEQVDVDMSSLARP